MSRPARLLAQRTFVMAAALGLLAASSAWSQAKPEEVPFWAVGKPKNEAGAKMGFCRIGQLSPSAYATRLSNRSQITPCSIQKECAFPSM